MGGWKFYQTAMYRMTFFRLQLVSSTGLPLPWQLRSLSVSIVQDTMAGGLFVLEQQIAALNMYTNLAHSSISTLSIVIKQNDKQLC